MARALGFAVVAAVGVLSLVAFQGCSSKSNDDTPPDGTPGGKPTVPPGTACTDDTQCGGGRCVDKACIPGLACTDDSVCQGTKCVDGGCVPASATNGEKDGDETDVDCGGSVAPRCEVGQACLAGTDCKERVCGPDGLCAAPTNSDGAKNGDETDVDCGGSSGNRCAAGKSCNLPDECDSRFCTNNVCEPRQQGRQDGDETDVDCGGTVAPACAAGLKCLADTDCQSQACDSTKHCALAPSCKPLHGGITCGTGEFNDPNKQHESCCKSLPVTGYADPDHPGQTVYVDKYEVTAGRMRAFIDATGGNVRSWVQAHRPAVRWNQGWEQFLPTGKHTTLNYTVAAGQAVTSFFPGDDIYRLQSSHPTQGTTWFITSGGYQTDVGTIVSLGEPPLFDEFFATSSWPEPHYSENHASNCFNELNSEGYSTYWQPKSDMVTILAGSQGKYFTQEQMDEKALNCGTLALYAAFCVWDGGQLMTDAVSDAITGNTVSPLYNPGAANFVYQNGKLTPGNSVCGGDGSLNTYTDGGTPCNKSGVPDAYIYPDPGNQKYDASYKIAPPGRLPKDVIRINPADEPWMDMIGNLQEAVLKSGETIRFDYRGYGSEFGSIQHHKLQEQNPRFKGAAFGLRCMRFK